MIVGMYVHFISCCCPFCYYLIPWSLVYYLNLAYYRLVFNFFYLAVWDLHKCTAKYWTLRCHRASFTEFTVVVFITVYDLVKTRCIFPLLYFSYSVKWGEEGSITDCNGRVGYGPLIVSRLKLQGWIWFILYSPTVPYIGACTVLNCIWSQVRRYNTAPLRGPSTVLHSILKRIRHKTIRSSCALNSLERKKN